MGSITEEQKEQIKSLLQVGQFEREKIASKIGVSPGTVSAIKAHITMGTYGGRPPIGDVTVSVECNGAFAPLAAERQNRWADYVVPPQTGDDRT